MNIDRRISIIKHLLDLYPNYIHHFSEIFDYNQCEATEWKCMRELEERLKRENFLFHFEPVTALSVYNKCDLDKTLWYDYNFFFEPVTVHFKMEHNGKHYDLIGGWQSEIFYEWDCWEDFSPDEGTLPLEIMELLEDIYGKNWHKNARLTFEFDGTVKSFNVLRKLE